MTNLSLSIGDVAQRVNVAPSTIRYYEKIGLLPPPARQNGRRRYSEKILIQLRSINAAQRLGWSLAEIKKLMAYADDHSALTGFWKAGIPAKIAELDDIIAQAQQIKAILEDGLDCDCQSLPECTLLAD